MITEMMTLPNGYLDQQYIRSVFELYLTSFSNILKLRDLDDDRRAKHSGKVFEAVLKRHAPVVMSMAMGLRELKRSGKVSELRSIQVSEFLDRFYMSRIAIRFLINQHLELLAQSDPPKSGTEAGAARIGAIDLKCNVLAISRQVRQSTRTMAA